MTDETRAPASPLTDALATATGASSVVSLPAGAPLAMLGDLDAAACEGDACLIPERHEHAIMARRLDDDLV